MAFPEDFLAHVFIPWYSILATQLFYKLLIVLHRPEYGSFLPDFCVGKV